MKLLKKLFYREPTFEEVAIEAKELFWQKQNKKAEVRKRWEERKQLKIQKMKEAAYLGFYRKPVAPTFHWFDSMNQLAGLSQRALEYQRSNSQISLSNAYGF